MASLDDVRAQAEDFLALLLNKGQGDAPNETLLDRLQIDEDEYSSEKTASSKARQVVQKTLHLTITIHDFLVKRVDQDTTIDAKLMRIVSGLLDLVCLVGIIPNLSDGVPFFPDYSRRSILDARLVTSALLQKGKQGRDDLLLEEAVKGIEYVTREAEKGIGPMLRDRVLIDFVCGVTEAAFSPDVGEKTREEFTPVFHNVFDRMFTPTLMPLLTTLLSGQAPAWFRAPISEVLSLVPLRPYGARQVIEFIAAAHHASMQDHGESGSSGEAPPISLQALEQAKRVLTSVPSTMSSKAYLEKLAPQLLGFLDGEAGPGLVKASAYIIGRGILGRKVWGQPGATGWRLFVQAIHAAINPQAGASTSHTASSSNATIVPEATLRQAVHRLGALVMSHPSPGLCKRIVGPILLPLWGLLTFAHSSRREAFWYQTPRRLLMEYIRLCATEKELGTLAESIFWDGASDWVFAPGGDGGVEIRPRGPTDGIDIFQKIAQIDQRVEIFVGIFLAEGMEKEVVGSMFLVLIQKWLFPTRRAKDEREFLGSSDDVNPLQTLAIAKAAQVLVERGGSRISGSGPQVLKLVEQLLDKHSQETRQGQMKSVTLDQVSYSTLSHISVSRGAKTSQSGARNGGLADEAASDETDTVAIALSLTSNIISASEFQVTPPIRDSLELIQSHLTALTTDKSSRSLGAAARDLSSLITSTIDPTISTSTPPVDANEASAEDRQNFQLALQAFLDRTLDPPSRVAALQAIHTLITSASPAILADLPALAAALQESVLTDTEDYILLTSIRTLASLASLNPRLVTSIVVATFVASSTRARANHTDTENGGSVNPVEASLEARLRIGEVLGEILAVLTSASSTVNISAVHRANAAKSIAEATTLVASRVGRAGKGARPSVDEDDAGTDDDNDDGSSSDVDGDVGLGVTEERDGEDSAQDDGHLRAILHSWSHPASALEEDARLRASALSVLGRCLELATTLLPVSAVEESVEVALAVLSLEGGEGKAVLRRAAVMVVMAVVRGVVAVEDGKQSGGHGDWGPWREEMAGSRVWEEAERVVRWVRDEDGDEVVRGHAGVVMEGLEARRMGTVVASLSAGAAMEDGLFSSLGAGGVGVGLPGGALRGLTVAAERGKGSGGAGVKIEELD